MVEMEFYFSSLFLGGKTSHEAQHLTSAQATQGLSAPAGPCHISLPLSRLLVLLPSWFSALSLRLDHDTHPLSLQSQSRCVTALDVA